MEAGTVPRVAAPRMPMPGPRLIRLASDTRLVGFVREGRPGAFEVIYDRHHRGILSFCRHMLGDQHEAEDAVQHTFMAAYSNLRATQQPIHLRPWLFAIARNRCYSVLRSQRERPTAELDEPATEGLAAEVQRREDLRDLVSDLNHLPDEQRAAIVLAELESLSHAEIADVLGVPRDKVKALVFQARESLLASRTARDTSCHEIRQQLAVGRGAALRRGTLRRHLRDCEGCRAYRAQVQHQRRQFGLLLPVAPTILAKEGLLVAAAGAGGAAAVGGTGLIASSALKTGVLKGMAAAVIAGIGTLGTVAVSVSDLPVRTLEGGVGARHARVAAPPPPAHHATRPVRPAVTSTGSAATVTMNLGASATVAGRHGLVVGRRRHHVRGREPRRGSVADHRRADPRTHGRWAAALPAHRPAVQLSPGHWAERFSRLPPGLAHRSVSDLPPGLAKKIPATLSSRASHSAARGPAQFSRPQSTVDGHGHAWGHRGLGRPAAEPRSRGQAVWHPGRGSSDRGPHGHRHGRH